MLPIRLCVLDLYRLEFENPTKSSRDAHEIREQKRRRYQSLWLAIFSLERQSRWRGGTVGGLTALGEFITEAEMERTRDETGTRSPRVSWPKRASPVFNVS